MLYVSRFIGDNYGVVDTDDDVETVISHDYLESIINQGLLIKGVETSGRCPNKVILKVRPVVYRDKAKAVKSFFCYGYEVIVNAGRIVAIGVKGKKSDANVEIRLSNFAKVVGDDILRYLPKRHSPLILVLDDSLEFSLSSFKSWYDRGVFLDLRELKSVEKAEMFYSVFTDVNSPLVPSAMLRCIFDDFARMSGYTALAYTFRGTECDDWLQRHCGFRSPILVMEEPQAGSAFLFSRLRKDFERLADSKFEMKSGNDAVLARKRFVEEYSHLSLSQINLSVGSGNDGWPFRRYDSLVKVMSDCTTCDSELLRQWFYAINTFRPSKDDLALYIKFCRRAFTFLVSK